jgi:hypothetical protein
VQRAVDDAHRLEVADRAEQIIPAVAGAAGAAAHEVEQPVVAELPGVLRMVAPDDVTPGGNATAGNGDRQPFAPIDIGDQLAVVQVGEDLALLFGFDPERPAAARAAAIEAEHQARLLRRAAMDDRIDAQAAVIAVETSGRRFGVGKTRPPHQRAVGEDPDGLGATQRRITARN